MVKTSGTPDYWNLMSVSSNYVKLYNNFHDFNGNQKLQLEMVLKAIATMSVEVFQPWHPTDVMTPWVTTAQYCLQIRTAWPPTWTKISTPVPHLWHSLWPSPLTPTTHCALASKTITDYSFLSPSESEVTAWLHIIGRHSGDSYNLAFQIADVDWSLGHGNWCWLVLRHMNWVTTGR